MTKNYYIPGEWNLICDVCGGKFKSHDIKERWDGLLVCPGDFETRHPQDFVKASIDKITVPFARPRPADQFTSVTYITMYVDGGYINNYDYYIRDDSV